MSDDRRTAAVWAALAGLLVALGVTGSLPVWAAAASDRAPACADAPAASGAGRC
ncbi:hypothetical protein [Blastococcus sp. SYSU D00695]